MAMGYQFEGMTVEPFTYEQYESTRQNLIKAVQQILDHQDKQFLARFSNGDPDWSIYNLERFPSIQWKLKNLQAFKESQPQKHQEQFKALLKIVEIL